MSSNILEKKGHLLGGSLLVAGTAIGGGMLALPVLTARGGFFPALIIYFFSGLFMASTGILWMEVFLWKEKEVNLISMAEMTLGFFGKAFAWVLYLFLFYSLSVAYVSGGGNLVRDLIEALFSQSAPFWIGPLLFVLIFAPFVGMGAYAVDRINTILMGGLILSFLVFIVLGARYVENALLTQMNWPLSLLATPVVLTSFGFQGVVPTLTQYMGRDPYRTRKAILFGCTLAFLTYVIWEWLILGVVPLDALEETRLLEQSAIFPLKKILHLPWLFRVGEFFAFFAIVTSFLGVTIGLLDFLADGLKMKKDAQGRVLLSLLVFLPPFLFTLLNPCLFLSALNYAGGIGCALLLGLLPILMAWKGRENKTFYLPGGKFALTLLLIFIIFELGVIILEIR